MAVAMILISMQQGLMIHKRIVRSLFRRPAILRSITKGLHTRKAKKLHVVSIHAKFYLGMKLKLKGPNEALILANKRKYKIKMNFKGFLSSENINSKK